MTPEEIKEMQDKNAELIKENAEFKDSNTKLGEDIKERDDSILDLKKNAKERGEQFKKLKDMSEAEKELLSEKELEIMKRTELLEEDRVKDREDRAVYDKKIKDGTINNLATKLAKGNADLAEQIKINLKKLSPELLDKAQTEEELTPYVTDAFNMTGAGSGPEALRTAHNTDGSPARLEGTADFSDSKEGKDLAGAMNLEQSKEAPKV